ncbi:MAG: putative signal transduction histidine kinase [Bacteroidetes bacterium]|nr:putative signal transduction histidine kinase [Bacteroidota bacterium]
MNQRIKILILEHDADDIEFILHELKKRELSFVHSTAANRAEFEKGLAEFYPDIVLSDYSFPTFNAMDAFEWKSTICPEVPFIIVSGAVGEEKAVELIKLGITDYVIKDKIFTLPGKISRALKEVRSGREKKMTEKELREIEKRLAEAQSIAHIGNWEVELDTGNEYWSDEIYSILGLKPGGIKPSKENFLHMVHPEQRNEVRAILDGAEKEQKPFSYSTRILQQNGDIRYVYSHGKHVFNAKGKALRQIGILQDVTETKRMEEELKVLNKELETFIYRASHDLRGPLSSIIGLTNVSKSEIKDEASKKYFQMVEASAQKLDCTLISLVQSMTMRDMAVNLEDVDFDELVKETLAQLKYHEGFSNVEISVKNTVKDVFKSNKLILTSVFQNLVQNAIKYQDYHSGQSYLKILISRKNGGVEIVFDDNGIGIDEHLQEKIFDMYFRGTSAISGTGLGLYIVKTGIEKLKGNIRFKSTKGVGTRFTVFLPGTDKN